MCISLSVDKYRHSNLFIFFRHTIYLFWSQRKIRHIFLDTLHAVVILPVLKSKQLKVILCSLTNLVWKMMWFVFQFVKWSSIIQKANVLLEKETRDIGEKIWYECSKNTDLTHYGSHLSSYMVSIVYCYFTLDKVQFHFHPISNEQKATGAP